MIAASNPMRWLLLAGALALAAWPFVFSSSYDLKVFAFAGIYAILVLGYQFIFGHAGALALTQGAFFGLAAYVTGILGGTYGWPASATLPLSILAPVLVAALIAVPVLRLETHYFALATLGVAQVALLIAIRWEGLTGGANGLPGVPGVVMFGVEILRGVPLVILIWSLVGLCGLFAWCAMRGLYGRAFHAMRTNEMIAGAIGIDTARLRLAAFLLSAAFAGLAGALHAHTLGIVSPEVLEFQVMVACLSMAVIGGRTQVAGAILAAVLLVHLPEWFRELEGYYMIAYGLALLAMIVVAPEGLIGLLYRAVAPTGDVLTVEPDLQSGQERTNAPVRQGRPLLSVEGVTKRFGGIEALGDVSFEIGGGIVGLIGPNGSGKTTLINVITGLYPADRGRVRLAMRDITGRRPFEIARIGIARTFQGINLVEDMLALDNVAVARLTRGRPGLSQGLAAVFTTTELNLARRHAMGLLMQLDLTAAASKRAGELPHGLKRRLEIARALALDPWLLLLDEPAAGLNAAEQRELSTHLSALAGSGITVLIVEHNMNFLMPLADRILCLDAGRLIADGTPAEIRSNPRVLAAYLGGRPRPDRI